MQVCARVCFVLAIAAALAGFVLLHRYEPGLKECNSVLGEVVRAFSSKVRSRCQDADLLVRGGRTLLVVGSVLLVLAVVGQLAVSRRPSEQLSSEQPVGRE